MKAIILIILLTVSFGEFNFDDYRHRFILPELKIEGIVCSVTDTGLLTIRDLDVQQEVVLLRQDAEKLMFWLNKVYGKDKY